MARTCIVFGKRGRAFDGAEKKKINEELDQKKVISQPARRNSDYYYYYSPWFLLLLLVGQSCPFSSCL